MTMTTPVPPSSGHPESDAAWQLIREDVFDRILDDTELERLLEERATTSTEPYADLVRLMLGMSLSESEARTLYGRVVDHSREMAQVLGRPVHVRVAALDLLTTKPASRKSARESRPIMVAPALLERALEEDLRYGPDVTTEATVPAEAVTTAAMASREDGVAAGIDVAVLVLDAVLGSDGYTVLERLADGARVQPGQSRRPGSC